MNRHAPMTKADDVRETPPELFDALNAEHRFTLDACATHRNHRCSTYYTEFGLYEERATGAVVQILGYDGTARGLLDLDGRPLAERLRTFQSVAQAFAAELAGASFDVRLGGRIYPDGADGMPQMRQSVLCESQTPVSGDGQRQYARLFSERAPEGSVYARTSPFVGSYGGLAGPWVGRVFINPPFSEIGTWIAKCWREMSRAGGPELIWFLIPATRTEQDWWHKLVEPFRDGRPSLVPGARLDTKFLRGRTHFLENGGPIYRKNRDGSLWLDPKTGEPARSSPKFGCVGLVWSRSSVYA